MLPVCRVKLDRVAVLKANADPLLCRQEALCAQKEAKRDRQREAREMAEQARGRVGSELSLEGDPVPGGLT